MRRGCTPLSDWVLELIVVMSSLSLLVPGACARSASAGTGTGRAVVSAGWCGHLTTSGGDLPAEHHRVVLVSEVVAVGDVRPGEVPEPAVHDHRLARVERREVLA